MSRDVKIEGLDKIAKALGQLGEEVQAEVAEGFAAQRRDHERRNHEGL